LGNFYQEQRALSLLRQTGGGFTLRQRQDAKALLDKPTNVMNIAGNATGVSSLNHKNTGMKYQNNRLSHRVPPSQPGPSSFFSPPSDSNERQFYPNLEESIQLATALSMSEQEQQLRSSNAGIMEVQCEAVENAGKSLFNHAFDGPRAQRGLFTPIKSPGEVSTSTKSDLSYITVMDQSPPVQDHALIEAVEYCKSLAYDAMCENSEDGVILEGYLSLNQTPLKPAIADCAKRAYERANGRKSRRENDEEECDGPEERKKMTRLFGVLSKANV